MLIPLQELYYFRVRLRTDCRMVRKRTQLMFFDFEME